MPNWYSDATAGFLSQNRNTAQMHNTTRTLQNKASQHDKSCCSMTHDRVQHNNISCDAPTRNHEQRSPAHHNTAQHSIAHHSTQTKIAKSDIAPWSRAGQPRPGGCPGCQRPPSPGQQYGLLRPADPSAIVPALTRSPTWVFAQVLICMPPAALPLYAEIRCTRLIEGPQSNYVARPRGARMVVIAGTGVTRLLKCWV